MAVLALGAVLVGCGPPPPQAPPHAAGQIDAATSAISTACGKAYRLTAFAGKRRSELAAIDAGVSGQARALAGVYRRHPDWIYQGQSVRQITKDSISTLRSCGLTGAARILVHALGR